MLRLYLETSLVLVTLRELKYLQKCKEKNCRWAQLQRYHQVPQRMKGSFNRRLQNLKPSPQVQLQLRGIFSLGI